MGTDRTREYECTCKCGVGKFIVNYCEPDHGWPTSARFWYEAIISCKNCSQKYKLVQQGKKINLVEKSELKKREELWNKSYQMGKDLLKTQKVQEILKRFILYLDRQPSMAAAHRLLTSAGLELSSVAVFRKRWVNGATWVNRNIFSSNLTAVMQVLGVQDQEILRQIEEIEKISMASDIPPKPVGDPIYEIKG